MKSTDFFEVFPDEREKGDSQLRKCQLVMLRMLKILDFLCVRHEVKYFLVEGSLRGAILYHGFLPWDDDLDIGMTRDNYEKFVEKVVPELPNDIFFQNDETDPCYPSCHVIEAKLRDKYSSYKRGNRNNKNTFHDGLQIDIAVYDRSYLPNKLFIYFANRLLKFFFKRRGNKKRANLLKWISKYSPFLLVYGNSFISRLKEINQRTNYIKYKEIKKLKRTKFEDMEAYIPIGWDSYLKRHYGKYKEIPSWEKQKGHHGKDIPDPFNPCNHSEILYWNSTKLAQRL